MNRIILAIAAAFVFCGSTFAETATVSHEKFQLLKEFRVTMPKYSKDTHGGRTGKDKNSGMIFAENTNVLREFIYPKNIITAGEVFTARLYRVVGKVDSEELVDFLDDQNTDLVGLQSAMLKKEQDIETDVPMEHMSGKAALWKNSKKDKGVPLMGCMVDQDIWFLYAVFGDFDFSETEAFLVFEKIK